MGLGLGSLLKTFAPIVIYVGGLFIVAMAMFGRPSYALALAVFLLPLRNVIEKLQGMPMGNQFIDILLFACLLGWIANSMAQKRQFLEQSSINIPAVIMIGYTLFSVMQGGDYLFGNFGFDTADPRTQDWKNYCLLFVLFFIVLNNCATKKDVWQLVGVTCVATFYAGLVVSKQVSWFSNLASRAKITGTFHFLGPNETAAFFNEITIILMSVYFAMKPDRKKWLLLGLIVLNVYCILFLYSRAAYAGLFIGMMILFALKNKKLLLPMILVAILWQAVLPKQVIERIKVTKGEYGQLDESAQRRLDVWGYAYQLYQSNPVTGLGFGVFRHLGLTLGDTHNIYVKILVEQGFIGFLIFLILIISLFREGFKLARHGDDELSRALGVGFTICLCVKLVNNVFGDRWSYLEPNAYFWVYAALVARLNSISRKNENQPISEPSTAAKAKPKPQIAARPKKKRYYDL